MNERKRALFINIFSIVILMIGVMISTVYYMILTDQRGYTLSMLPFLGIILASFLASLLISVLVHEFGHLVFGKLSGYDLNFFRVFSWTFVKWKKRVELRKLSIPGTAGQCLMVPTDPDKEEYPFILYNLGGIILNFISILIAICLILFVDLPEWVLLLGLFININVMLIFINSVPFATNDGANIKNLLKSSNARRVFYESLVFERDKVLGDFSYETHNFTGVSEDILLTHIVDMHEIDKAIYEDDNDKVINLVDRYFSKNPPASFYQLACKFEKNYAMLDKLSKSEDPSDISKAKDLYKIQDDKALRGYIKSTSFPSVVRRDILYYSQLEKDQAKLDKAIKKFRKLNNNYYDKFTRIQEKAKVERLLNRGNLHGW